MPSPWLDFWPKVALAVINSLALGGVALVAAYWFNRQLERHKRNEAITAELGKQSVGGYLKILAAIGEINGYLVFAELALRGEGAEGQHKLGTPIPHLFGDTDNALGTAFREIFKNASLVNSTFAEASIGFLGFATRYLQEYDATSPPTEPARRKLQEQRAALLVALSNALPRYVSLPNEDAFKLTRSLEDIFVGVGIWHRDDNGEILVAE
jgi:hypothetical protein